MNSSSPPPSSFPSAMGPGARPMQPGDSPTSMIQELQEIRSSYFIKVDSDTLHLAYNFKGQNRKYDLPFINMPLADGSKWLLYGGTRRAKVAGLFTLDLIRGAENMAGRPLTQTEAEAFAFHTGKRIRYNFLGTFVGFSAGYLYAATTWKTMKFPFMKPKPMESYDYFPSKRLAVLKGGYSRIMWQITRANLYAAISLIFAQTIFGSIGDSVMTVGLYRDQRTQDVVKAVKGGFDRIRMNRSQPGQAPPLPQKQQGYDQDPQATDFYGNEGTDYSRDSNFAGDQTFTDDTTDTGALDDSTMRQRERKRETKRQQSPAAQPSQSRSRKQEGDFFFDDASPTAGADADSGTSRSYQQGGGGSVWDRIRRGSQPRSQPSQPAPPPSNRGGGWQRSPEQTNNSQGDSFSFSSGDEEKQLAKAQAQREFDAMLERERRESGSETYRNDSYATEATADEPRQSGGNSWGRRRGGS